MKELRTPCSLDEKAQLPVYQTAGSAGCDVCALEKITLRPGETKLVRTGLSIALPDGYELQVRPRSGLSMRTSLRIANSPGTIDSDYRDEIQVIAENTFSLAGVWDKLLIDPSLWLRLSEEYRVVSYASYWALCWERFGEPLNGSTMLPSSIADLPIFLDRHDNPYGTLYFDAGDRIAQIIVTNVVRAIWEPCSDVRMIGKDRGGGFGSTGVTT